MKLITETNFQYALRCLDLVAKATTDHDCYDMRDDIISMAQSIDGCCFENIILLAGAYPQYKTTIVAFYNSVSAQYNIEVLDIDTLEKYLVLQ